jgi:hypothetical protein
MNVNHELLQGWPKWLRIVFLAFGFIFLFFLISQSSRATLSIIQWNNYPANGSVAFYVVNFFRSLFISPWTLTLFEYLAVLIIIRAILFTLNQGKDRRSITLAILYGLIALFLVIFVAVLESKYQFAFDRLEQAQASAPLIPAPQADNNLLVYITAITGLITAASGFYGQVLSARKLRMELELQRLQMEMKLKEPVSKPKKKTAETGKSKAKRSK